MIRRIFSFKKIKAWFLNLKGISSGCYAYKGPDVVQIDCTDRCNSNCLACWTHSLLIKDKEADFKDIQPDVVMNFIREIKSSGTREVCFSGGGEPFLHPRIWEILDLTQEIGMKFRINTNFTLLDEEKIKKLVAYDKLASLTVSIWGHDADLYSKLHGRSKEYFYKVRDNLKFLNYQKSPKLNVVIYSVITNMNYSALRGLLGLAQQTGCKAIEFALVDAIPGATDALLLDKNQLHQLKEDLLDLIKGMSGPKKDFSIVNKDLLIKRILSVNASHGEYDVSVVRKSCYAGWIFLRLRANGDLNSCLKAHHIPVGNIYKDDFLKIWNNKLQQQFREKCLSVPKDKKFFKSIGNANTRDIGCKRSCDNIVINEHVDGIIRCLGAQIIKN